MTDNEAYDPRNLLNQPLSSFPDLPDLPGSKTWFGKLTGEVGIDQSSQKKTPFIRVGIRITDPGEDVPKSFLEKLSSEGFSLADYDCGANFYITPNAMKMLRRFLTSLGFSESVTSLAILKLDAETGAPTLETKEVLRGLDIIMKTPAPGENGSVYWRNMDAVAGTKRD